MKQFFAFMVVQFVSYLNLTINFRAIAHEQYAFAVVTDGLACILGYTIVKLVNGDKSRWGIVGMTAGGMCAAVVGIWLTRAWG